MDLELRILLIEDNLNDASRIQAILKRASPGQLAVEWAASLHQGLGKLMEGSYDAVLLALMLRDASDLQGLQQVLERVPYCPVIILIGMNNEQLILKAIQMGAQDFLLKPSVNGSSLHHALLCVIRQGRLANTLRELASALEQRVQRIEALNNESTPRGECQPPSDRRTDTGAPTAVDAHPDAPD